MSLTLWLSAGCAFYEKKFVSEIALEGTNHRPAIYDEGAFYINADPQIRIRMGCFAVTTLLETMSLLVPFPFGKEVPPHDSIAAQQLSLTLRTTTRPELDLSTLTIQVETGGRVHPLVPVASPGQEEPWRREVEFASDLACDAVKNGSLRIQLDTGTTRTYGVHFTEGVRREFAWHPTFVT